MTLVECFDREPVENMMACLQLRPEKVLFLGDEAELELSRYRKFLRERKLEISLEACPVDMGNVRDIIACLEDIVDREDKIVIDVTGGAEQVVLAVGMVLAQLDENQRQRVDVQRYDVMDEEIIADAALTVREVLALHGGLIFPRTEQPGSHYTPDHLKRLWDAMCADNKDWNKSVMILNEFESRCDSDTDIYLPLNAIAGGIARFEEKLVQLRRHLDRLSRCGVIEDRSSINTLRYSYRDPLLRSCAQKAGNVLEIKSLLEARAIRREGKAYFGDCVMSVNIDWDGVVHDSMGRVAETRNEMDLILVRGVVPLFVSCKNGEVDEDELYKLHTVAHRFGGAHARKMLIATDLDRKKPGSVRALLQRAKDMDIYVVKDAAALSNSGWQRVFVEATEGKMDSE